MMHEDLLLAQKFAAILPHLNEKQRRLLLAAEARALAYGGISRVARAAGVSRATIHKALQEQSLAPVARIRRPGGGRKKTRDRDPALIDALEALVQPDIQGDRLSPLRWTGESPRQLAEALQQRGHHVSEHIVRTLLHEAGYSLQAPARTRAGHQPPDHNTQFGYLNEQIKSFLAHGWPVISVDTKKKELSGAVKDGGRASQSPEQLEQGTEHDVLEPAVRTARPYRLSDAGRNPGWVTVSQDEDTASFAVASLCRWWEVVGCQVYPQVEQLLVCADSGGRHSYRVHLWQVGMQHVATTTGLHVTVCHVPPGTRRWNTIEHWLFTHSSMNWCGRPLVHHEIAVALIGTTTPRARLHRQADVGAGFSPTKKKISEAELAIVQLTPHPFSGEWNYTISPR